MSTGLTDDLKDLKEYESCATCGKARVFRCVQCGGTAKMTRVQGNS